MYMYVLLKKIKGTVFKFDLWSNFESSSQQVDDYGFILSYYTMYVTKHLQLEYLKMRYLFLSVPLIFSADQ